MQPLQVEDLKEELRLFRRNISAFVFSVGVDDKYLGVGIDPVVDHAPNFRKLTNREALGLVSRHEQWKRLPPKPPINAKILGVGCDDRMRSIQFRESNEASVRIVHRLAITREQCAYRC